MPLLVRCFCDWIRLGPIARKLGNIALLLLLGALLTTIVACGGGGGPSSSFQAPPPRTPTPTPSPTPVSCTTLRRAHFGRQGIIQLRRAAVPARISPGPAQRVCRDATPGRSRCMAWIRTDIKRSLASGPAGYAPADLQSVYKLAAFSSTNGGNQIVAIVDAYDDPSAEADLGIYRSTFALSPCTTANGCFLKVNQYGASLPLPPVDATGGWEGEESVDLDMVSAVCPNCEILLVEANSSFNTDFYNAEDTAATACGANVISNSWGGAEYSSEVLDEVHFNRPGVMMTFSAGDHGFNASDSGYPSASQYVTSVGGTNLVKNAGVWQESAWTGTGSVCSLYIPQPAWQTALGIAYTNICSRRIDNDVAAVADPNTGVAIYDSFGGSAGCPAWCVAGGTSVSAPIVAAVYALAGNGGTLTSGSYGYSHLTSLLDITSGSNGSCLGSNYLCTATAGYDGPTGNGSPNGIGAF